MALHSARYYIISSKGIQMGNKYNKIFKDKMTLITNEFKLDYNENHPNTYFPEFSKTNPDFVSKTFWIECKYSTKGRLYETNFEQIRNYLSKYESTKSPNESIEGYLLLIDGSTNKAYMFDAERLAKFKFEYTTFNKGYTFSELALQGIEPFTSFDLSGLVERHYNIGDNYV